MQRYTVIEGERPGVDPAVHANALASVVGARTKSSHRPGHRQRGREARLIEWRCISFAKTGRCRIHDTAGWQVAQPRVGKLRAQNSKLEQGRRSSHRALHFDAHLRLPAPQVSRSRTQRYPNVRKRYGIQWRDDVTVLTSDDLPIAPLDLEIAQTKTRLIEDAALRLQRIDRTGAKKVKLESTRSIPHVL